MYYSLLREMREYQKYCWVDTVDPVLAMAGLANEWIYEIPNDARRRNKTTSTYWVFVTLMFCASASG